MSLGIFCTPREVNAHALVTTKMVSGNHRVRTLLLYPRNCKLAILSFYMFTVSPDSYDISHATRCNIIAGYVHSKLTQLKFKKLRKQ